MLCIYDTRITGTAFLRSAVVAYPTITLAKCLSSLFSGGLWWIWPVLGIIFVPWTTIMFVIVAPGGLIGWDWLWLGLMLLADIAWYAGGAGRKRIPGYEGS